MVEEYMGVEKLKQQNDYTNGMLLRNCLQKKNGIKSENI